MAAGAPKLSNGGGLWLVVGGGGGGGGGKSPWVLGTLNLLKDSSQNDGEDSFEPGLNIQWP